MPIMEMEFEIWCECGECLLMETKVSSKGGVAHLVVEPCPRCLERAYDRGRGEEVGAMRYRKRPIVVEAMQWLGDNYDEIEKWGNGIRRVETKLLLETLEGTMTADLGDWIIKGVKGELYPCKPDIFDLTYEPAQT